MGHQITKIAVSGVDVGTRVDVDKVGTFEIHVGGTRLSDSESLVMLTHDVNGERFVSSSAGNIKLELKHYALVVGEMANPNGVITPGATLKYNSRDRNGKRKTREGMVKEIRADSQAAGAVVTLSGEGCAAVFTIKMCNGVEFKSGNDEVQMVLEDEGTGKRRKTRFSPTPLGLFDIEVGKKK